MPDFITIDKDGKETINQYDPDTNYMGFFKRDDGNFCKILDDPRCISRKDKIKELEKLEEEKKKAAERPKLLPNNSGQKEDSLKAKKRDGQKFVTKLIRKESPSLAVKDILKCLIYSSASSYYIDNNPIESLSMVRLSESVCELPQLEKDMTYAKIEIDKNRRLIKLWFKTVAKERPDIVITNCIKA